MSIRWPRIRATAMHGEAATYASAALRVGFPVFRRGTCCLYLQAQPPHLLKPIELETSNAGGSCAFIMLPINKAYRLREEKTPGAIYDVYFV